ncbi:hypothetical protein KP509_10G010300 [Ceratopteris richardii]|uniref:RING-type E3 ubiquitin transferase n=1 Tax=Ceratopteris richardii TaxID=49495 RepID=A0A8T2U1Y4_CERRI|nr:hypothetical protein KP509_10G010300 [Ceratopteris richardii]
MANSWHLPRGRRYYGELLMPPLHPTGPSLIHDLISLSLQITDACKRSSSYSQRGNVAALSRRISVLLLFLHDLRDSHTLPPSAIVAFSELHVILQGFKLLAQDCAESSRISLLVEHRRLSELFHRLTTEMATALEIVPLPLLDDVSSEMREQMELLVKHTKKAKMHVDAKDSRLYLQVRRAMGQIERKEAPEGEKLDYIFRSLELFNAADCEREIEKLEAEQDDENMWDAASKYKLQDRKVPLSDLVSFVRYGKCVLYGASEALKIVMPMEDGVTGASSTGPEDLEIPIPEDFLCPISLELMKDPVIVATGQTYDRLAISRWIFDSNNRTCPKSGLPLSHTTLIPNCALRSLIHLWCIQNNVFTNAASGKPGEFSHLHSHRRSSSGVTATPTSVEATKLTVDLLLRQLLSASCDTQRHIAGELRVLAKCSAENRKVMAEVGAIPPLITLLSSSDIRTQEHAVAAILNLSIYGANKERIVELGALEQLMSLVERGSSDAVRENAAASLFSLSRLTQAAEQMGKRTETIRALLRMVKDGSPRGRRDAASAIFNMAVFEPNRELIVRAGAIETLVETLASLSLPDREIIEEELVAVLAVLACTKVGRKAITSMGDTALPMLGEVLRIGGAKARENAAAILLCLCRHEGECVMGTVLRLVDILTSLQSLLSHGTPRAKRKAASLIRVLLC